jgi:hypothetical protein
MLTSTGPRGRIVSSQFTSQENPNGVPSVPQLLEAIGECYNADPGGTKLALKVLLRENDLLPTPPSSDETAE